MYYRAKQEEAERRKSDEKARREQIFKQYLVKKEEEEEGPKQKSKPKTRPKSMFVKAGPAQDLTDYDSAAASVSNEDLSSKAPPSGGNKPSACKFYINAMHSTFKKKSTPTKKKKNSSFHYFFLQFCNASEVSVVFTFAMLWKNPFMQCLIKK